jgi:hypothetical protein
MTSEQLRFTPSEYNCLRPGHRKVMFSDGKIPLVPTGYDANGEPEDWTTTDGQYYPKEQTAKSHAEPAV